MAGKRKSKNKGKLKDNLKPKEYKRFKELNKELRAAHAGTTAVATEVIKMMPENVAQDLEHSLAKLHSSSFLADPIAATQEINHFNQNMVEAVKNLPAGNRQKAFNIMSGQDAVGYEPAGSMLRRLYPNPFAVYAFLGDNYWAAVRSRREVRVEVEKDGIILNSLERTAQRKVKLVYNVLKELDLLNLRVGVIDHLNLFGNAWLKPIKNPQGGILKYELLLPEHIVPIWDNNKETILGWEYTIGAKRELFAYADLVHLKTYSARTQWLGSPGLCSVVVDMEASMFASLFNNTVFQKGGMIGSIVSLKNVEPNTLINEKSFSLLADAVQSKFERRYGGVRGAGQIIISPYVDKVHPLMKLGEMDASFQALTVMTDRKVAQLLCCAPEKIGIPMTSQYQDKGLVADRIAESFDNNVLYLSGIFDNWVNVDIIADKMNFKDVNIQSGGAYKAQSVAAGQYGVHLAATGGVITRDEYRVDVLKKEPFGGDIGRQLLDNSRNRDMVGGENAPGAAPPELGPALPDYAYKRMRWVKHNPHDIVTY